MTLSGRDEHLLREAVKRTEGVPLELPQSERKIISPLPKLAKANEPVQQFELGKFELMTQKPNELVPSESSHEAYAFCPISTGQFVLLHRCTGEASGGYWLAVPCIDTPPVEYQCPRCSEGVMKQIVVAISGLADTADATYDGWADAVNGVWTFDHTSEGTLRGPCNPGRRFLEVPNNSQKAGANPFVTGLSMLFFNDQGAGIGQASLAQLIVSAEGPAGAVLIYRENPANLMTRTSDKIDCSQKYADYLETDAVGAGVANFSTWFSAATITINPSQ